MTEVVPPDVVTGYRALREDAAAVDLARDVVSVAGPDAEKFLQGQLSQDLATITVGGSAWALLLQPQGKVVALLRVVRTTDDTFLLDTDGGWGVAVLERLARYKLRVKCDLEALPWRAVAVRGPRAHEAAEGGTGLVAVADWPGLAGVDLLGESPAAPPGLAVAPAGAWEAVRIEAGIPVMGRELDERTIPAEAGVVEQTVSFTKGCYTGQELVARIDSRGGNVPRRLRLLTFPDGAPVPPPAATVRHAGKDAGAVTSSAWSPGREAPVALAYVGRAVTVGSEVEVAWDGGSATALVDALSASP